jgi:hypothetical protein
MSDYFVTIEVDWRGVLVVERDTIYKFASHFSGKYGELWSKSVIS